MKSKKSRYISLRQWRSVGKQWIAHFRLAASLLLRVKEFKYLQVLLTSEGKIETEIISNVDNEPDSSWVVSQNTFFFSGCLGSPTMALWKFEELRRSEGAWSITTAPLH